MVFIADEHVGVHDGRWVLVPRCPPGSGGCGCRGVAPCPLRAPQTMHTPCLYVHEGRWCWCLSVGHSSVYDRLSVCHEGRWCWCLTWCGVLAGSWGAWVMPSRWSSHRRVDVESMVESSKGRWFGRWFGRWVDRCRWVDVESMGRWCVSAWRSNDDDDELMMMMMVMS